MSRVRLPPVAHVWTLFSGIIDQGIRRGIRVAVGDCNVTERRLWRPPTGAWSLLPKPSLVPSSYESIRHFEMAAKIKENFKRLWSALSNRQNYMCTQNTTNTTRTDGRRRVCAAIVPYRWATRAYKTQIQHQIQYLDTYNGLRMYTAVWKPPEIE